MVKKSFTNHKQASELTIWWGIGRLDRYRGSTQCTLLGLKRAYIRLEADFLVSGWFVCFLGHLRRWIWRRRRKQKWWRWGIGRLDTYRGSTQCTLLGLKWAYIRLETDFLLGVFFITFILTTFTHNSILFISSKVRMVVCSDDIVEITCSIDYWTIYRIYQLDPGCPS